MFRVGQNDEPLTMRGSTHLIEHLALAEFDVPYSYNGGTGPATTTFYARGSGDEVGHFLNQVISNLANLPWHRTETEAAVLKAEAASRSRSSGLLAAYLALGPTHLGSLELPEIGLDAPDPAKLDSWRRHYFSKQNCAIWFSGPQPPMIDLSQLPEGERRIALEPKPILPSVPHLSFQAVSGLTGLGLVPRTTATTVASVVLSRRLTERLRGELGIAYGASIQPIWTSAQAGFLVLGVDCAPEKATEVYRETTIEITKLAYGDLESSEVERYVDQIERAMDDPASGSGLAAMECENALLGRPLRTTEEAIADVIALTADQVGAAIENFALQAVWIAPNGSTINDQRVRWIRGWSTTPLKKVKKFLPKKRKDKAVRNMQLQISSEGLMLEMDASRPDSNFLVIKADEIVAVRIGANGDQTVYSRNAKSLTISQEFWLHGEKAAAMITGLVPESLIVREQVRTHETSPAMPASPPPPTKPSEHRIELIL